MLLSLFLSVKLFNAAKPYLVPCRGTRVIIPTDFGPLYSLLSLEVSPYCPECLPLPSFHLPFSVGPSGVILFNLKSTIPYFPGLHLRLMPLLSFIQPILPFLLSQFPIYLVFSLLDPNSCL